MSHDARLGELKIELPAIAPKLGVYRPVIVSGGYAYLSGHGPVKADGTAICGRVGEDLDRQAGYDAARQTGLVMLATLRRHFGSLDKIRQLVKTVGFVNATPDFKEHPAVINGFSELMRDVFGDEVGIGARSALGVASIPAGWAVEIEAIFEVNA